MDEEPFYIPSHATHWWEPLRTDPISTAQSYSPPTQCSDDTMAAAASCKKGGERLVEVSSGRLRVIVNMKSQIKIAEQVK